MIPLRPVLFPFLFLVLLSPVTAQQETAPDHDTRMQWWREARFGMFIHWGLYAIPAGEWNGITSYGEWIRHSAKIPVEIYDQFQQQFNPVEFDAAQWVNMAKNAGMKYIVITTKHHDGFCMYDTKETDFNITNTPFGRDVMKELAEACRKYDMKLCFYYSIMDWHHPDYLPRRDWEETDRPIGRADYQKYVKYMNNQLRELLTQYGDIGVLWFDGEWESFWNEKYGKELYRYVRSLQPSIIINNRLGAGRFELGEKTDGSVDGGDFGTPEQEIPTTGIPGKDWETCMTMNDHWGYNKANTDYKSTKELIRMLVDIASKGGNYLLNVGPTAEGTFPSQSIERLNQIGQWMKINGESIYKTQASPFKETPWGRCTMKETEQGVTVYLHVFSWPENGELIINGCLNEPQQAYLLADPTEKIAVVREDEAITLTLPPEAPDSINSVIKLELTGKLDLTNPPEIHADFETFVDFLMIEIASEREQVDIRFTMDGSEPTNASFRYVQPFEIRGTATISARCFRDGKPVSGITRKTFSRVIPFSGKRVTKPVPGINYYYYEGDWDSIPVFSTLSCKQSGVVPAFTLEPKAREERYGFVYKGYIHIPERSIYTFYLASDDGSRLYLRKKLLIDNDGLHGYKEKEGSIGLNKGFHEIEVEFFEKTGSDQLELFVKSALMKKQALPEEWLFY